MELKKYQQLVIEDLEEYLGKLSIFNQPAEAYKHYWKEHSRTPLQENTIENYKTSAVEWPNVCIKVPTAWWKTFVACNAIYSIFSHELYKYKENKVVVWLVPSDTILTQTYDALNNPHHPYRKKLNFFFWPKIEILNKQQVLRWVKFNKDEVKEQVTIVMMTFDSLRAKTKETRKMHQDNSAMISYQKNQQDDLSVMNVIKELNPLCVIDESHRAVTDLSLEMIKDLNPFFTFELTATPKENANIISYVNAFELKKENMVKLPVILHNNKSREDVIWNAINLRNNLEQVAIEEEKITGKYIRPIVLFQAQPKNDKDLHTFESVKKQLIAVWIPEHEIAIKTSHINELKWEELMDKNCRIRYIITINALKEWWDCPFAYILASLANKNSSIDVEQILWRVLRQPHVTRHESDLLNLSYVFTASNDFYSTIESIVSALNNSWFSSKNYRDSSQWELWWEGIENKNNSPENQMVVSIDDSSKLANLWIIWDNEDDILDVSRIHISDSSSVVDNIQEQAIQKATAFDEEVKESLKHDFSSMAPELQNKIKEYSIKEEYLEVVKNIKIPQFFIESDKNELFDLETIEGCKLLEKQDLNSGFTLNDKDININFQKFQNEEIKQIDIKNWENDTRIEYKNMATKVSNNFILLLKNLPKESHLNATRTQLKANLWRIDDIANDDLDKYLQRVLESLWKSLDNVTANIYNYSKAIKKKIEDLQAEHRKKVFWDKLEIWSIELKPYFSFPEKIILKHPECHITNSLYQKENDWLNGFEKEIIDSIANNENTLFWVRNIDRDKNYFCINWFINHYPDFIIYTKKGNIIFLETKWKHLETWADTALKIELWNTWSNKTPNNYKYFLVAQETALTGGKTINDFFKLYREL